MIVELTGLPGAGKTTYEPSLILGLKQRGIDVISRAELKDRCKQAILTPNYKDHPPVRMLSNRLYRLSIWNSLISAGLGGGIFREFLAQRRRMVFSWLAEDIHLSTFFLHKIKPFAQNPNFYIPNEGLVHHSASFKVWGGAGFSDLPKKLLKKIPSHEIAIFYFKVPMKDALNRVIKRGLPENWPRTISSEPEVKEVLLRFEQVIEDVVQKFRANGVQVFMVDTSVEPHAVESKIRTILDGFSKGIGQRE
ncbi:MAG: hypothetical protein NPINA01_14650 [Nitrospinaceae bacterium]|nr:MAG: hypothetical protein NPINA01_14650 [Nitrospinaceae bacterium]